MKAGMVKCAILTALVASDVRAETVEPVYRPHPAENATWASQNHPQGRYQQPHPSDNLSHLDPMTNPSMHRLPVSPGGTGISPDRTELSRGGLPEFLGSRFGRSGNAPRLGVDFASYLQPEQTQPSPPDDPFRDPPLNPVEHAAAASQPHAPSQKQPAVLNNQPLQLVAPSDPGCGCAPNTKGESRCKSGCCNGKAGCCNQLMCNTPYPYTGIYGSYEQTYLKPHFEDGQGLRAGLTGATISASALGLVAATVNTDYEQAEFDFGSAPRLILGCTGPSGTGIRGQYWSYDDSSSTGRLDFVNVVLPPVGVILPVGATVNILESVSGVLELQATDVELTHHTLFGAWELMMAGGVRYGTTELQASNDISVTAIVGPVGDFATISWDTFQEFSGIGPTVSFDIERPFGNIVTDFSHRRGTQISFFATGRASLLFGDLDNQMSLLVEDTTNLLAPLTNSTTAINLQIDGEDDTDDLLTILQAQIGVEFARELGRFGRVFARTALEAQVWQGAGGFQNLVSPPASLSAILPAGGPFAGSSGDIGLVGASIAFGFGR